MSQPNPEKTLIFLHIPKAGGSTLHHVLDWNYERTYTVNVYNEIADLITLPDEEKRQIQCLKGTVFYGIHQYLPQECTYVTIMRDPVERMIAHYYDLFVRKRRLGEPIGETDPVKVLEEAPYYPTYQLRLLLGGDEIESVLHDPLPPNAVQLARQNIERDFAIAGVLEHYDETLLLMKRHFGWSRAYYPREIVSEAERPNGEKINDEFVRRVKEMCAPETELYRTVRQQTAALIVRQDASFDAELRQLRRGNARFERLYRLATPFRKTPIWNLAKRTLHLSNRW